MHNAHTHSRAHTAGMKGVLQWSMAATVGLVAAELIGGILGRSIALISDAVHNLTDVPALMVSWAALRLAERPPTAEKTYGYHRAGILAAFTNAILLALVALYVLYESYVRLRAPIAVHAGVMLWLAVVGLAVNGGITLALVRGRGDLNLRSVLIHNLGDALSNVAILVGALAIRWTGAAWVDPLLGIGIGVLVLWSSFGILRESSHILLEGIPRGVSIEAIARTILSVEGVREVHDIHVWTLGAELHALSCHVRIPDMHMEESERILNRIAALLAEKFQITHTTIQFERAGLPREATLYLPDTEATRAQ